MGASQGVVVGLDNGGTSNNATVLDTAGRFLIDGLLETPSRVKEGPAAAIPALVHAFTNALDVTGTAPDAVLAVGLDTPGPATAEGVLSSRGRRTSATPTGRCSTYAAR